MLPPSNRIISIQTVGKEMNEVYGYVYKITNKLNGKCYIGQRKSQKVDEHYWGSGNLIQAATKKYGVENFDRVILEWCNSKEELNQSEIKWISEYDSVRTGYNLSPGGNGGYLGEVASRKVSEGLKRYYSDPENRRKHSESLKGMSNGQRGRTKDTHSYIRDQANRLHQRYVQGELVPPMQGKKHSIATKQIMSECKIGEQNPFYGKHHSQKSKDSMSQKLKGRLVTEDQRKKISIANSGERNGMYGKTPANAGKISITNGITNKYIHMNELSNYTQQGWWKGNTQHHKNTRAS